MIRIPRIVVIFFVADVLMLGIYLAHLVLPPALGRARLLFSLGHENNLPTWYSSVQLFTVGVLLALFAYSMLRRREPRAAWLLAGPALFFFLSLDELAMIHERLPDVIRGSVFAVTGAWMIVWLAVGGLIVLTVALIARRYWLPHRRVTVLFMIGFALLAFSAGGLEILTNVINDPAVMYWQIAAEEFGEMVAVTILLWASWELLLAHGLRVEIVDERLPLPGGS